MRSWPALAHSDSSTRAPALPSSPVVSFTDDGRVAAVINGSLHVWDEATGTTAAAPVALYDTTDPAALLGPTPAFSSNGRLLGVPQCDQSFQSCTIQLWDVASGRPHGDPIDPAMYVVSDRVQPRRQAARHRRFRFDRAVGHREGQAVRRTATNRRIVHGVQPRQPDAGARRQSRGCHDGRSVVSLWDVATQDLLRETSIDDAGAVSAIAFRPPKRSALAVGFGDGEVRLLNPSDLSPAGDAMQAAARSGS